MLKVVISIAAALHSTHALAIPNCRAQADSYVQLLNTQKPDESLPDANGIVASLIRCLDQQSSSADPLDYKSWLFDCSIKGNKGCFGIDPGEKAVIKEPDLDLSSEKYIFDFMRTSKW